MRTPIVMIRAAASFVAAGWAASADEISMRVTVDHPGRAPLSVGGAAAAPTGRRVVLEVGAYQPSQSGPIVALVAVECSGNTREIGRFSVFPDMPFAASDTTPPQRYGFELPAQPDCASPTAVTVQLVPVLGDGVGASMMIATVRVE